MAEDNPAYTLDQDETQGSCTHSDSGVHKRNFHGHVPDRIVQNVTNVLSTYREENIGIEMNEDLRKARANGTKVNGLQRQERDNEDANKLYYSIRDSPPWSLSLFLGFQHYLTMIGGTISIPFLLSDYLCITEDDPARAYLLSTILFVSGMITLLQATVGVRLPIIQGGTFALVVPTIAILTSSFDQCDLEQVANMTQAEKTELWQVRMREVQGAIALSSLFQVIIGFTGLVGMVVSVITPLVIAPTISLVGLSLFDVASAKASSHWGIASLTIVVLILFSQYLHHISVPLPTYSRSGGCSTVRVKIFGLMPVLLTIGIMWMLCLILTVTGVFNDGSPARTDAAGNLIADSLWVRVPYPFQWGIPTASVAGVFGMLAGIVASVVESIGDYYACAKISGAPPPPRHALNRGVGIEGVGSFLAGLWGSGNGTTSYSENIGAIGITKVGSRRVILCAGVIMILCACVGKLGAVFVSIPEPIIGGIFCITFAMITAVGLSVLQTVDLSSSRNLFVLGFPIFFGLSLSKWMQGNPDVINTGSSTLDQIISVLLQTSMLVGGLLGIILDNTIPGTDKERGVATWKQQLATDDDSQSTDDVYDLPFGMSVINRVTCFKYIPVCPPFKGCPRYRKCCGKQNQEDDINSIHD